MGTDYDHPMASDGWRALDETPAAQVYIYVHAVGTRPLHDVSTLDLVLDGQHSGLCQKASALWTWLFWQVSTLDFAPKVLW